MQTDNRTIYLAARGFEQELINELRNVETVRGRLVVAKGGPQRSYWAQNIWLDPVAIPIESIGDAASKLKEIQRNWWLHSTGDHRRAKLIQEKLPHVSAKPITFGDSIPDSPLGSWTLWDKNLVIASARCSSNLPDGEMHFVENKEIPPTRAYLKLWELFTLLGTRPAQGQLCIDAGSSPGGWSWVIAECGARVFSMDKAPLAEHIESHPNINHCQGSAFGFDPRHAGTIDWLFSDVICYPDRLLQFVERWLELGDVRNFACTIKLQGETDYEVVKQFAAIPNSKIFHLFNNKHELTWVLMR